jgi:hypothetical protein
MTDLSPAAQTVLKAACIHHGLFNEEIVQRRRMVAAALRAVVDQVVPEFAYDDDDIYGETIQDVRHKLLAIAAELEDQ